MKIIAVHVCVMASVFMLGTGDLALRLSAYHQDSTPPAAAILTIAAAIGVCTGGYFGGTLVYMHGTGVAVVARSVMSQQADGEALLLPRARAPAVRHGMARHDGPVRRRAHRF